MILQKLIDTILRVGAGRSMKPWGRVTAGEPGGDAGRHAPRPTCARACGCTPEVTVA
jgi:hypothetical protein